MGGIRRFGVLAAVLAALFTMVFAASALADTYQVTSTADVDALDASTGCATPAGPPTDGARTLRSSVEADDDANTDSTIQLQAATYTLTAGELVFFNTQTVTITGVGAGSTIIDGNFNDRDIYAEDGAALAIDGVTMRMETPAASRPTAPASRRRPTSSHHPVERSRPTDR
jgi:hypothetical protein